MSTKAYIDSATAAIVQPLLDERDARIAKLEAAQPIDHRPLLGRIDALEAENERLANNNEALESDDKKLRDFIAELEAELAALREALVKISKMDNIRVDYWNNEDLYDAVSVASAALLEVKDE